ncbi:DUF3868 domain-containing protein [Bacteroides helcogenes]|uniref:Uncharacterized protein n=1 Tax=Bacteroides helcogenes (strain ATCC 35417 / DSM 20613 / JCM 6297 / CCUG 15421 / P 36-108) TaxID=693979 RepID=E6SPQ5_BACT6|nr:DUF3868 domain-containing protein [Bacteroides helcogenes]ADV43896.1 hypothetical protein Bache_1918 [Bacteroides helcogenes P 36-108]MDY5237523.1 DUF3868 domain-containing protein [Bacteroides helcogenes]
MKRAIYLILLIMLPALKPAAQSVVVYKDQVRIENQSVTRSDDNRLTIAMDIIMQSNMKISSNRAATLTPMLEADGNTKALAPVVVYGRRRNLVSERNKSIPKDAFAIIRRKRKTEQKVSYLVQLPYEAWMQHANLTLDADLCGCRDVVEASELDPITTLNIERTKLHPAIAYIAPKAEEVKHRAEVGSAFLDYPVNKTVIYPEYRRNQSELAKIRAIIDTIRADKNISITGIRMEGYASPEGSYANNTRLAKGRTEALLNYVRKLYNFPEDMLTMTSTPEDWAGFRKFVGQSSLPQKEEILQIIDLDEKDMDAKEHRIARFVGPDTYRFLLNECYPALRHSDYTVSYTVRGFNVDETRELINTRPQQLSLQEIYNLAQTCKAGSEEFNHAFQVAVLMFPNDPTANLNAAAMEIQRGGDLSAAKKYLAKADASRGETQNNLGVIALMEGDLDAAAEHLNRAQEAGITEAGANIEELTKQRNFPVQ